MSLSLPMPRVLLLSLAALMTVAAVEPAPDQLTLAAVVEQALARDARADIAAARASA